MPLFISLYTSYTYIQQFLSYSKVSNHFMESEVSLQRSHKPATGPYPEPDESSPHYSSNSFEIHFSIIIPIIMNIYSNCKKEHYYITEEGTQSMLRKILLITVRYRGIFAQRRIRGSEKQSLPGIPSFVNTQHYQSHR
jgi:hypothetical protein